MSRIGQGIKKSILTANSVLYAVTASVPAALSMAASRILGRKSSGNISAMTVAELLTLIGVEAGAKDDLTGDEIVTLLEALAGAAQLSHTKISDLGATDHHTAAILQSLLTTKGDVIARTSSVPVRVGIGANDEVLTADSAQASGLKWATVAGASPFPEVEAGDILEASADAARNHNTATYVKKKEIKVARAGTFRVKFDLRIENTGDTQTAYGQVYRNGAPVGTEQSELTAVFVTKSEDIAGWTRGDLCQLYIKRSSGTYTVHTQNFRLYEDFALTSRVDID